VRWTLPAHSIPQRTQNLSIGLFRAAITDNDKSITVRHAMPPPRQQSRQQRRPGGNVSHNVSFHAPRAVGSYTFRLFDKNRIDETLCVTDPPLTVEVQGRDVLEPLDFVRGRLQDRDSLGSALIHLQRLIQQLRLELDQGTLEEVWRAIEMCHNKGLEYALERLDSEAGESALTAMDDENGDESGIRWAIVNSLRGLIDAALTTPAFVASLDTERILVLRSRLIQLLVLEASEIDLSATLRSQPPPCLARPPGEFDSGFLSAFSAVLQQQAMELMPDDAANKTRYDGGPSPSCVFCLP